MSLLWSNIFCGCFCFPSVQGDFRVQKEACWAISNIAIGGNPEQQATLLNLGIFSSFSDLLKISDAKVLTLILEVIKKLFEVRLMLSSADFSYILLTCPICI